MNDELNLDELDGVQAGYSDSENSINAQINSLQAQLNNPNNSIEERRAIYLQIEKLQKQQQETRENNSVFHH